MENKPKSINSGKVYSYLRFSTPEQALGDSERRQVEAAKTFAADNSLEFDESLVDRGVSGFTGAHRKRGVLGVFLKHVEAGDVPPGSVLVVENLDRLGREEPVEALAEVVFALVRKGIAIQTLTPIGRYDRESLNGNGGDLFMLVGGVQRAHAESQRKSDMVGAAWKHKLELAVKDKKVITRRLPAWLTVGPDGEFVADSLAVRTINRIFKMKLDGIGVGSIAKKLNSNGAWKPAGGWRESYIDKILRYRAVIGEHQSYIGHKPGMPLPAPIPGYFPQIVDAGVFHRVQEQFKANGLRGGAVALAKNLFVHIARCAYCGGPMILMDHGKPPKGVRYLMCDRGRRGVTDASGKPICHAHAIKYEEVEKGVLDNCIGLRPEQVLPPRDEQDREAKLLRKAVDAIDAELADIESRTTNLMNQIETEPAPEIRQRYQDRMAALDARKVTLEKVRADKQSALATAEHSRQSVEKWRHDLKGLRTALAHGNVETRLRMRVHLRELIDRIEVFAAGFPPLPPETYLDETDPKDDKIDRIEQDIRDVMADFSRPMLGKKASEADRKRAIRQAQDNEEFIKWIVERRHTKHGRFIRVHFKSGIPRDVVPGDSIADGRGLEIDENGKPGWTIVSPSLSLLRKLWLEHKRRKIR